MIVMFTVKITVLLGKDTEINNEGVIKSTNLGNRYISESRENKLHNYLF